MIRQNVIWDDPVGAATELYYRVEGPARLQEGRLTLPPGSILSTHTYMNLFDLAFWDTYTHLKGLYLELEGEGTGELEIWGEQPIARWDFTLSPGGKQRFSLADCPKCQLSFRVISRGCTLGACAYGAEAENTQPVCLGLVICTYRREKDLERNLSMLERSPFFDPHSPLAGKLQVFVVDNASSWQGHTRQGIHKISNPNTGGSGGFARGMEACISANLGITHVVLMDDDVWASPETFLRLYALLSAWKPQNPSAVAGRMFRLDRKQEQLTAAEIWNGGNLIHIAPGADMTRGENLQDMNGPRGEYSGWWFACYPMSFVRENLPLPFFLHCDDVEYGLRWGQPPLVLNGIQVWHTPAEHRRSPMVSYYDLRNTMIVNSIRGTAGFGKLLLSWMKTLYYYWRHAPADYGYAALAAMEDYLRGQAHFLRGPGNRDLNPGWLCRRKWGQLPRAGWLWLRAVVQGTAVWRGFREVNPGSYSRERLQKNKEV